jgi:hypothetical protein
MDILYFNPDLKVGAIEKRLIATTFRSWIEKPIQSGL